VTSLVKSPAVASAGPILAIETSTQVARVVLVDPQTGARRGAAHAVAERHSSNLLRLCAEVIEKVGVPVSGLGAIACGAGPGSFTGLRVGLAVAKGLAIPTGIPLIMVSSLEALAMDMSPAAARGELVLPCLDAGKGEIYAALFDCREDGGVTSRGAHWASLPADLPGRLPAGASVLFAGPGAFRYRDVLAAALGTRGRHVEVAGPSADAVARRAIDRLARGEVDDLGSAVPSYGRAPDITRPQEKKEKST
jgi:tRNA threonylcarbamoyladenosine biosynthesis protein TsaB